MKLKFKNQKFQADAAKAVVDVFKGQPRLTQSYLMDFGKEGYQTSFESNDFTGWANQKIVPELSDEIILENLNAVQREYGIEPSKSLDGRYNITIEMETGERVIIVTRCINAFKLRVSETLTKYISSLLRVIKV